MLIEKILVIVAGDFKPGQLRSNLEILNVTLKEPVMLTFVSMNSTFP